MLTEAGLDPAVIPGGYAVITAVRSRAPFRVGELLALGGEFERELSEMPLGRKPSKWDGVTCEWFGTDYDAAAARAAEVRER